MSVLAHPDVSVVIPTHNRRSLLGRALTCALGQRDVSLRVVVVDDASDDDTAGWARSLGDPRLVVVRQPRRLGVAAARNAGLERADTPWVAFLDDDDVWSPAKLSAQLAALAGNPRSGWACASAALVDERLRIRAREPAPVGDERLLARLLAFNVIPGGCSGVIARTGLVRSVGGFDGRLSFLADWDLWIRLAAESPVTRLTRPLLAYVLHGQNMTASSDGFRREIETIREKHAGLRASLGVELDEAGWLDWLANVQRRSGQRLGPALAYAGLGWRTRQPRRAALAAATMVWPGSVRLRDRLRVRRMPSAWRLEAEAWLAPLRVEASGAPG